jgi:hypothetical protein
MKAHVESTLNGSLGVQWGTLFINLYALTLTLPSAHRVLTSVLTIETLVQVIQLSFYTWYAFQVHRIGDVTRYRYLDWIITTPLMLFTTMVYFEYRNTPEEPFTLEDFWNRYWKEVLVVGGFNLVMLIVGYLQELGLIGLVASTLVGFGGLFGSFAVMYDRFASKTPANLPLFWSMFSIWSFYGVAAWFPPMLKNTSYNVLDIFAKNFYGLFLSYRIATLSTT